ncbi:putative fringe-like protein [Neofusicoccum parvum UCRNP2]|uniref:N-acetylgalactosaminide beta-1,3-galactosyltransferase n=1 Tax=Botryosphaeria parva (strain UCR-NP2) TaxID=1287680 RepID=R1ETL4_BOTPV|nr:putative fringe-like protein [Neofusicoccum parvum UCRNP2]
MATKLPAPLHTQLPAHLTTSRAAIRACTAILVLALLWQMWSFSYRIAPPDPTTLESAAPADQPCPDLSAIFVALKTGVAETRSKLPVHFATTLSSSRCTPPYGVFSDHEEDVDGHAVADALDDVDELLKLSEPDFEIYNRLQRGGGRDALSAEEREAWGGEADPAAGARGGADTFQAKEENPTRRLDKWKMVPLVDKALRAAPEARWFVFVEPDTYVLWRNLAEWLERFDPGVPWYLGEPEQMGADVFAHGGAGVVLSAPAMRRVSQFRKENQERVDELTRSHGSGDCVLGKILVELDVPLTWSWPNLQSGRPSDLDWSAESEEFGRLWCHRAVSYHGLSVEEIEYLYAAEQDAQAFGTPLLQHRHVFQDFVLPQLSSSKPHWDNHASRATFRKLTKKGLKIGKPIKKYGDCRLECDQYGDCIGFSWIGRECRFSTKFQLGQKNETGGLGGKELTSGFMMDRVDWMVRWLEDEECTEREEWVLPVPFKKEHDED